MISLATDTFRIGFVSASANQLRMEYYTRTGSSSDNNTDLKVQARMMELQSDMKSGDPVKAEQALNDLRSALSALRTAKEALESSRQLEVKA